MLIGALALFCSNSLYAQNYNFTSYNLKEGLPQSQVSVIFQAANRMLWLGTYGGLSCFDGTQFTSYGKADGLYSNTISGITEDALGRIIVGTANGINVVENGKVKKLASSRSVHALYKAPDGVVWGITEGKLFRLHQDKMEFVPLDGEHRATTINADQHGRLYTAVRGSGIFVLQKGVWKKHITFNPDFSDYYIAKLLFDKKEPSRLYVVTFRKGIFLYENGVLVTFFSRPDILAYFDADLDSHHNIWLGTEKGAYLITPDKKVTSFNEQNGLTNNRIAAVLNDAENNIWMSSFTNGIFKYEGNEFIRYDRFKGQHMAYPINGLAVDKQNRLWVSTFSSKVFRYDGHAVTQQVPAFFNNKSIYFLTADREQNIVVSIQNQGLWQYDGRKFNQIPQTERANFSSLAQDEEGGLYLGDMTAVTFLHKGKTEKIAGFSGWVSCLYAYGGDSILVGTTSGVYLIKDRKLQSSFNIPGLRDAYVLCILKQRNYILFATLGDGIIVYDLKSRKLSKYRTVNGLNSNDVYTLTTDSQGIVWAGTGRGINKLKPRKAPDPYIILSNNSPIVECNQNALINYAGEILVGTTGGVILCNTSPSVNKHAVPSVFFQKINAYHKTDNKKDTSLFITLQQHEPLMFSYKHNHVSISYKGIFLTNPRNVVYRYRLVGVDNTFSKATTNTQAEYSVLQPGKYTFQVYAEANGKKSATQQIHFLIVPPFYEMWWFKATVIVVCILLLWTTMYAIFKRKEQKKKEHEQIKLKEQKKIRKQTAEDFHDDIGNKLTRINVLSEILDKKIDGQQQEEEKELVRLIKENAGLLYNGTKDILWALDPKSDNLYEIMQHIKDFCVDLFQGTPVKFSMEGLLPEHKEVYMSMEQNRNLTLVFKETLNNVLKHAMANEVCIQINRNDQMRGIEILITDDGTGFDLQQRRKGNGLKNMENRCKRIHVLFNMTSSPGKGTCVRLYLPFR